MFDLFSTPLVMVWTDEDSGLVAVSTLTKRNAKHLVMTLSEWQNAQGFYRNAIVDNPYLMLMEEFKRDWVSASEDFGNVTIYVGRFGTYYSYKSGGYSCRPYSLGGE